VSAREVQKKTGARQVNALLNELVRAGLVESEEYIPRPAVKPKFVEMVRRDLLSDSALRGALDSLPPRRKKVRGLLEELLATGGVTAASTQVSDLLRHTGASLTQFRELVSSGVITTERVEVSREQDFGTELQTLGIVLNDAQGNVLSALTGAMERGEGGTFRGDTFLPVPTEDGDRPRPRDFSHPPDGAPVQIALRRRCRGGA
jgi:hypothetical protein